MKPGAERREKKKNYEKIRTNFYSAFSAVIKHSGLNARLRPPHASSTPLEEAAGAMPQIQYSEKYFDDTYEYR